MGEGMKIYVAGPMTGIEELNFPAFNAETARLRALGHEVINPAEVNPDPKADWTDCMVMDIRELLTCEAIVLLPGWEKSKGARIEHAIAVGSDMHTFSAGSIGRGEPA